MTRRFLLNCATRAAGITAAGIPMRGERPTYGDIVGAQFQSANLVGLQAGVIENGRTVWAEAYGFADIGRRIAMTPDTIINIASVSKTVTATAVMQLCEDQRLSLDDDINRHLPFAVRNPFHSSEAISVRHLLTHTSSIADGPAYAEAYLCGDARLGLREWLSEYLLPGGRYYHESNFHSWQPGERFEYSNVGFGLLGLAVETVSYQPFADVCAHNIFQPLAMASTSFTAKVPSGRQAIPYTTETGERIRDRVVRHNRSPALRSRGNRYVANCLYAFPNFPDGLVRTTVRDFSRFISAVLCGGQFAGHRILKALTLEEVFRPQYQQAGRPASWPAAQGLAWYALRGPNASLIWLHTGADPGVRTVVMCHLPTRCAALLFANTAPAEGLTDLAGTCLRRAAENVEGPKMMKSRDHPLG